LQADIYINIKYEISEVVRIERESQVKKDMAKKRTDKNKDIITPRKAANLAAKDEQNVLKLIREKVKAGTALSVTERKILDELDGTNGGGGDVTVTSKIKVAKIFNVNVRTIRRWEMEGMPVVKIGRKRSYNLLEIDRWYQNKRGNRAAGSDEDSKSGTALKLIDFRKRRVELQNRLLEIDVLEKEGLYIKRDEVNKGRIKRIQIVKTALLALPQTLGPLLSAETDPKKCIKLIDTEVRDMIKQFADGGKKYLEVEKPKPQKELEFKNV